MIDTLECVSDAYPQFIYRFIEQTLQPGPAISLKCSATGNPTPKVLWLLDGFPLPRSDRLVNDPTCHFSTKCRSSRPKKTMAIVCETSKRNASVEKECEPRRIVYFVSLQTS
jgi:hypothetical protein